MLKVRTKIYLIVILMFLTITTLTASTYAWFEMNQFASVNNISMNVVDGADMSLSLDGENWKRQIDGDDLYSLLFGVKLEALTSIDGMKLIDSIGRTPVKKSYVEYDLYFKLSDLKNVENDLAVYLTNYNNYCTYEECKNGTAKGTYVKSEGYNFYNNFEFLYDYIDNSDIIWEDGKYYMAYQEDAIRVSFEDDKKANVFDLSQNPSRGYNYTPNKNNPETQYGAYQYTLANKLKFDNCSGTGPEVVTRNNFTKYKSNTIIPEALDNNSFICELHEVETNVYIGKTTIRIWLEGWDADCFDCILKDSTMIQFEFTFAQKYVLNEE